MISENEHWFEGETIQDVYGQLTRFFETVSGSVDHISTRVIRPDESLPDDAAVDFKEVQDTVAHLTMDLRDIDFWFNHKTRIYRYGPKKINQFGQLAGSLALKGKEVYGTFAIMEPSSDFGASEYETPPPFFSMGQFSKTADGTLSITGVYRRQEMSSWWIVNVWELIRYRDEMINMLQERYQFPTIAGWVSTVAISAHWRKDRKPMVAIPEFDQPAKEGELGSLVVAVFDKEKSAKSAADKISSLLRDKIEQLSSSNAPSLGSKNLIKLLKLLENRLRETNEELYIRIFDQLSSIQKHHELFRKEKLPDNLVASLKKAYQELMDIFKRI